MNRSTVRTSSQDVDDILSQEGGPIHKSGLLLCGQQGLLLTLATAAGRAAVCYRTHMADADAAGRSLCKALAEPRVSGLVALCFADGAPSAPCQEGGSSSLPLLDGEKPQ